MILTLHPALYEHISEVDRSILAWRSESPKGYDIKDIRVDLLEGIIGALFVDSRTNDIHVEYDEDITIRIYAESYWGCRDCPPVYTTMKLFSDGTTEIIE